MHVERHSTHDLPIFHTVREELGGGSAFAAGMISALHFQPLAAVGAALRRADLLAALCQQSAGDFSTVSAAELQAAEQSFGGRSAVLPPPPPLTAVAGGAGGRSDGGSAGNGEGNGTAHGAALDATLDATLDALRAAKVLAIVRTQGPVDTAVARGLELVALGCTAIEVTLDSADWPAILSGLRSALPSHVRIGVGTVMDETVGHLAVAASLGASFALSPIDPLGFVDECHRLGVLPVPSAFTSNEMWSLRRRGVRLIKLFHAGLMTPPILKSMLGVGPIGTLNIMPSGGVSPSNAIEWLRAGAAVVGMGSNLVGKLSAASDAQWESHGRQLAKELFVKTGRKLLDVDFSGLS